ncbi:MAG: hypothetical protein MJZ11_09285 [Lachnospiraceae bacterium]|nr:hypothetical protein [Lachnospiraceae bacterium]
MKHCIYCGHELNDNMLFCESCGKPQQPPVTQQQPQYQQPVYQQVAAGAQQGIPQPQYQQPVYQQPSMPQQPPKSKKKLLAILIPVILVIIIATVLAIVFWPKDDEKASSKKSSKVDVLEVSETEDEVSSKEDEETKEVDFPDITYSYLSYVPEVKVSATPIKTIYPRQYNRLDSIIVVDASSVHGDTNVRVYVEIPGFTQAYTQTLTLGKEVTTLFIKPSLVNGSLGLTSAKNSQMNFKVENLDTGKLIREDTFSVKLMSEHDIDNYDPQWGESSMDAYMSFLTPEDDCIDVVSRTAVDEMTALSKGKYDAFAGYQYHSAEATYYQILAVQCAISDLGVKYDAGGYSNSDSTLNLQSVKLPKDVLSTKGGLCVETSLLMASTLMNEGMHCFLVFPPGHCQVAVETDTDSGEYFLVETTLLPVTDKNINKIITGLNGDEWQEYITNYQGSGQSCYLVDCSLANQLGFQNIAN